MLGVNELFLDASFRNAGLSVFPLVHLSVRRSVYLSVMPAQNPRFSAVFGYGKILYWIKWTRNVFWMPLLLLCHLICLSVYLSLHICHIISAQFNTRRDTVRTHRCPIMLVKLVNSHSCGTIFTKISCQSAFKKKRHCSSIFTEMEKQELITLSEGFIVPNVLYLSIRFHKIISPSKAVSRISENKANTYT